MAFREERDQVGSVDDQYWEIVIDICEGGERGGGGGGGRSGCGMKEKWKLEEEGVGSGGRKEGMLRRGNGRRGNKGDVVGGSRH